MNESISPKKHFFQNPERIAFYAILLCAAAIRLVRMSLPLQYDEIWTLNFFVPQNVVAILSDLATPNNHVLNTLYLKFLTEICAIPPLALPMRLPNWLLGCFGCVALYGTTRLWFPGRRGAALMAMALGALLPLGVWYGAQARGYGLQTGLLGGFLWALSYAWLHGNDASALIGRRRVVWCQIAAAISLTLATITLVTSVLFAVVPLALYGWTRRNRKDGWLVPGGCALLSAAWILPHWNDFRHGQSAFGVSLLDGSVWRDLLAMLCNGIVPWMVLMPTLVMLIGFLWSKRKVPTQVEDASGMPNSRTVIWFALASWLVPVVALLLLRSGFARTYLPSTLFFLPMAGFLWCEAGRRASQSTRLGKCNGVELPLIGVMLMQLGFFLATDPFPNWQVIFEQLRKAPSDTLVVYRGNDAMPALWNNMPEIGRDFIARLGAPRKLWMLGENGTLSGVDKNGGEHLLTLKKRTRSEADFAGISVFSYELRLLNDAELRTAREGICIAFFPTQTSGATRKRVMENLPDNVIGVNLFLGNGAAEPLLVPLAFRLEDWSAEARRNALDYPVLKMRYMKIMD